MGEYDGMDYTWAQHKYECEQNFKKQQRWDPDHDGYIEYNGKKFRSEKELDVFLEEEKIKNLISCGMSVPEIRNWLSNPKWNPTEKQIELMKLAKEAKNARLKRFLGTDFTSLFDEVGEGECLIDYSGDDELAIEPADIDAFEALVNKPGTYKVKMSDGYIHVVTVFDDGCYSVGRKLLQKKIRQYTRKQVSKKVSIRDTKKVKPTVANVSADSLIVIDGSNIIGVDECLRVCVLKAIVAALKKAGYEHKVFVDKSIFGWLRKMKDEEGLRYISEGEKQGVVMVAPNKAEADGQILQLAEFEGNVHVITNDRYRDYVEMHPWLADRSAGDRLHGVNLVRVNDKVRVLIAGFNLDIVV